MKFHLKNANWFWLSLLLIGLDQATKWLALNHLVPYQPKTITPFFNFTLMFNKGAAFSFLAGYPAISTIFFSLLSVAISIAIIIWILADTANQKLKAFSLSLILGGAIGNLIDRLLKGQVTDFISLHYQQYFWPTFNMADSAIVVGAILFAFSCFSQKINP